MNQYRITSADFCPEGGTGEQDAFLSIEDQAVIATVTSQSTLASFLKSRVAGRMAQPETEPEHMVTLIREQRFDSGKDKL